MKILFITLEQSGRQIVKSILDDNFFKTNYTLVSGYDNLNNNSNDNNNMDYNSIDNNNNIDYNSIDNNNNNIDNKNIDNKNKI